MNRRDDVIGAMEALLADTYTLYLKTLGYHWNVTGPMFMTVSVQLKSDM